MENLNNKSALSNILGLPKTVISELADEYFDLYETIDGFLEDTQEWLKDYKDIWSFLLDNQQYKSIKEYVLKNK
jgi:hypothetical protein